MENKIYYLYDSQSGSLIEHLFQSQLLGFLLSITESNRSHWLIWQEGNDDWDRLNDVYEKFIPKDRISPPPLPDAATSVIFTHVKFDENVSLEDIDKRLSKRFTKEIPLYLTTPDGKISNNISADISISGIRLKNPLPAFTEEVLSILIRIEPHPIEVLGKLVMDIGRENCTRIKLLPNKNIDVLRKFLLRPDF